MKYSDMYYSSGLTSYYYRSSSYGDLTSCSQLPQLFLVYVNGDKAKHCIYGHQGYCPAVWPIKENSIICTLYNIQHMTTAIQTIGT